MEFRKTALMVALICVGICIAQAKPRENQDVGKKSKQHERMDRRHHERRPPMGREERERAKWGAQYQEEDQILRDDHMMRAEQPKYPKIAAYAIRNQEKKSRPGVYKAQARRPGELPPVAETEPMNRRNQQKPQNRKKPDINNPLAKKKGKKSNMELDRKAAIMKDIKQKKKIELKKAQKKEKRERKKEMRQKKTKEMGQLKELKEKEDARNEWKKAAKNVMKHKREERAKRVAAKKEMFMNKKKAKNEAMKAKSKKNKKKVAN